MRSPSFYLCLGCALVVVVAGFPSETVPEDSLVEAGWTYDEPCDTSPCPRGPHDVIPESRAEVVSRHNNLMSAAIWSQDAPADMDAPAVDPADPAAKTMAKAVNRNSIKEAKDTTPQKALVKKKVMKEAKDTTPQKALVKKKVMKVVKKKVQHVWPTDYKQLQKKYLKKYKARYAARAKKAAAKLAAEKKAAAAKLAAEKKAAAAKAAAQKKLNNYLFGSTTTAKKFVKTLKANKKVKVVKMAKEVEPTGTADAAVDAAADPAVDPADPAAKPDATRSDPAAMANMVKEVPAKHEDAPVAKVAPAPVAKVAPAPEDEDATETADTSEPDVDPQATMDDFKRIGQAMEADKKVAAQKKAKNDAIDDAFSKMTSHAEDDSVEVSDPEDEDAPQDEESTEIDRMEVEDVNPNEKGSIDDAFSKLSDSQSE